MRKFLITLFFPSLVCCYSQTDKNAGGPCEGCEALFEYGSRKLANTDTLPHFASTPDKLILGGVVYKSDGITPAEGIIIYAYHTDEEGIYVKNNESQGWEQRHGYLRGWAITGPDGKYTFYTNRPASYPDSRNPQHVHLTVKEPGIIPYYIDDIHFLDDPLLTEREKSSRDNRAGSGLVDPVKKGNTWYAERDIILGLNIPDYPL